MRISKLCITSLVALILVFAPLLTAQNAAYDAVAQLGLNITD